MLEQQCAGSAQSNWAWRPGDGLDTLTKCICPLPNDTSSTGRLKGRKYEKWGESSKATSVSVLHQTGSLVMYTVRSINNENKDNFLGLCCLYTTSLNLKWKLSVLIQQKCSWRQDEGRKTQNELRLQVVINKGFSQSIKGYLYIYVFKLVLFHCELPKLELWLWFTKWLMPHFCQTTRIKAKASLTYVLSVSF